MTRLPLEFCASVYYSLEKVVKIFQVLIHFIFILKVEEQLQIITLLFCQVCVQCFPVSFWLPGFSW